jgi:glutamyl/glutaminyl-tRNA synthetase
MTLLTTHIDKRSTSRRYCVGTVKSATEIPAVLQSVSPHFLLFLAMDATSTRNDTLRAVARALIDSGMAYLCVWGNDCSRVHDQFDLERDPNEPDGRVVTTTWHDDEPLSEALWYFANCAYPDDAFEFDCRDWVALSVGNVEWEREIRSELVDKNEGWPP